MPRLALGQVGGRIVELIVLGSVVEGVRGVWVRCRHASVKGWVISGVLDPDLVFVNLGIGDLDVVASSLGRATALRLDLTRGLALLANEQ